MELRKAFLTLCFLWILLLSFIECSSTKNGTYQWSYYQYGTPGMDVADAVITNDDNGYIYFTGFVCNIIEYTMYAHLVAGNFTQVNQGYSDVAFLKLDPLGNITNSLMFGTSNSDKPTSLAMKKEDDSSLTFYICGQTSGNLFETSASSGTDAFIASVRESDFTFIWTNHLVDNYYSNFAKISLDSSNDNNLYAIGYTSAPWPSFGVQPISGSKDVWIVKFDRHSGSVVDMNSIGSSGDDAGIGIAVDSEGNVYGVGSTDGDIDSWGLVSQGGSDALLFKMDSQGNFVWVTLLTTSGYDDLYSVVLSPDQTILYAVGGSTSNMSRNGTEIPTDGYAYLGLITSISSTSGDILDAQVKPSSGGSVTFNDVTTDPQGRLYVCGTLNGEDFEGITRDAISYDYDIAFAIYAANGSVEYAEILGSTWDDDAGSIYLQSDSTVWMAGYTAGTLGQTLYGSFDMLLVKAAPILPHENSSEKDDNNSTIIIAVVCTVVPAFILAGTVGFLLYKRRQRRAVVNQAFSEQSSQNTSSLYQNPRGSGTNYGAIHAVRNSEYEDFPLDKQNGSQDSQENSGSALGSTLASDKLTQMLSLRNDWIINYDELLLEKKIGAGAFGEVFRGSWRGIPVAVKRMIKTDAETEQLAIEDFLTEASLMKKLRPHPNITLLLGVCSSPLCIVTEFVSNGSLLTWLHSNKPMDNDMKISIIRGIAAGMLHLHREGVIHRDLAARNILITSSWKPKVSDFGLSRVSLDNALNKTEAVIGPIKWMAPEALLDKVYNTRTDVWSFGVVIYEVLVRKNPYYDQDAMQVGTQVALGKLNLVDEIQKENDVGTYPEVLLSVMKQCLQYSSEGRPEFQQIIEFMDQQNGATTEFVE